MSELRYHPFLKTWVITAKHRQDRTFHPPADFCPLCPTLPGKFATEIPRPDYDIAVFENKFASLHPEPPEAAVAGCDIMPVRPASGVCEVICYSSRHDETFATLPERQIRKLARVWRERYVELSSRKGIEYVFVFENKGSVIGVTLSHPHGQIYAYPFIPSTVSLELAAEKAHFENENRLLCDEWLEFERGNGAPRILFETESFVALVPFFARYTYEVHLVAKSGLSSLADMSHENLDELAFGLQKIAKGYDKLFGFSMPYIMAMHQFDAHWSRFHVEFYPPHRTADKLKYLAGSEAGAGAFINDKLPEDAAQELRQVM